MKYMTLVGAAALMAVAGSAGCVSTGAGYGTAHNGKEALVTFDWRSGDAVSGVMTATFGDGRVFRGRYFQITEDVRVEELHPLWDGWPIGGPGWRHWHPHAGPKFVTYYSGKVLANLNTTDGERMRCSFQLVHPATGMQGGGEGECQLTGGMTLDATFPGS